VRVGDRTLVLRLFCSVIRDDHFATARFVRLSRAR